MTARPSSLLITGSKSGGVEHLPDLDLGRAAEEPLDRLLFRLRLDHPEAGDELFRLGEGAVDHRPLAVGPDLDPRALRARLQARRRPA